MSSGLDIDISRRRLLLAAGLIGGGLAGSSLAVGGPSAAPSELSGTPASGQDTAPPLSGLHLQFGEDASTEVAASWHTLQPVRHPRVLVGHLDGRLVRTVEAAQRSYTDAKSGQIVHAYHARIGGLQPDQAYLYAAVHQDAAPEFGSFRTAPRRRARFSFTSFGDQGTRSLGKRYSPPEGATIPNPPFVNDNLGSP